MVETKVLEFWILSNRDAADLLNILQCHDLTLPAEGDEKIVVMPNGSNGPWLRLVPETPRTIRFLLEVKNG
jgi:hypothetical protein